MSRVIDRGKREFEREIENLLSLDDWEAAVGILDGQGGEEVREGGITNAEIMQIHEFGAPVANIPERSVLRHVADAAEDDVGSQMEVVVNSVMSGSASAKEALSIPASTLAVRMSERILNPDSPSPRNAPATVANKDFNNPLVEEGELGAKPAFEVRREGETESIGGI